MNHPLIYFLTNDRFRIHGSAQTRSESDRRVGVSTPHATNRTPVEEYAQRHRKSDINDLYAHQRPRKSGAAYNYDPDAVLHLLHAEEPTFVVLYTISPGESERLTRFAVTEGILPVRVYTGFWYY